MRYVILAPVALLIWGAILFPLAVAVYGIVKWRGSWRIAAAVPLVTIVFLFTPRPPGWGLIFIPFTMFLTVYSAVVVLLHRKRGTP